MDGLIELVKGFTALGLEALSKALREFKEVSLPDHGSSPLIALLSSGLFALKILKAFKR